MEALLILIVSASNAVCFFIGAKVGQTVVRGEKIKSPKIAPMKAIREHRERKDSERKQETMGTIMRNIENYDGTPRGQEDVPRG